MVFGNSMFAAGLHADDGPGYWAGLEAQHDRYLRSLKVLVVSAVVILALSFVIHPALAGAALALVPIIGLHIVLVRHSRTRVRIPDYRS